MKTTPPPHRETVVCPGGGDGWFVTHSDKYLTQGALKSFLWKNLRQR